LNLAQSIDYKIIKKERSNLLVLESLLFGQAGFLNEEKEDIYFKKLQSEYKFLLVKYDLHSVNKGQFQFFRLRPNNFPTIRLAQLGMLYFKVPNLFSKIIAIDKLKDYYELFDLKTSSYWEEHYTFNSQSLKKTKKLTISFINLLLINTIIPLKFIYQRHIGKQDDESILNLIKEIPSEKNSIITKFESLLNKNKPKEKYINNAMESQAFLQLKTAHCNPKNCLQCAIGNAYLKN